VACVTPLRRIAGRQVTTVDGLDPDVRRRWADAFVAAGASQCGFCTPGIVLRLAALATRRQRVDEAAIRAALLAHLCRCTGWETVVDAACDALAIDRGRPTDAALDRDRTPAGDTTPADDPTPGGNAGPPPDRDALLTSWRAQLEGPAFQSSGPDAVLGRAGFADDTAPAGAVVAVPNRDGELVIGVDVADARRRAGKVQGRNSTAPLRHPVDVPDGDWALTLRTTWVEPAYLEPDASWCTPGGVPASPLANGGAFGGKRRSPVAADAARLATALDTPVRVVWSREDVVRRGPKRPPVALGIRADGTGVLRIGRGVLAGRPALDPLDAVAGRVQAVAPGVAVEVVDVAGPPTSADLRGAGWVEASVALTALAALAEGHTGPGTPADIVGPSGGRARVTVADDGAVAVDVWAGELLDPVTLRSYCIGAVHQALGWVRSEGIAVDAAGDVHDLTVRSFGVLPARDTPRVDVTMHRSDRWPVNGSDAVFAATAAAAWLADGLPPAWPTRRGSGR
jgi:hypothetical protein